MRQAASEGEHEGSRATTAASRLEEVLLSFDPAVTNVDAVQRAAYKLSDRLSIEVDVGEKIFAVLHLRADAAPDELVAEFRNEVLDQTLRERIRVESEAARNLILALAFSKTGLIADE